MVAPVIPETVGNAFTVIVVAALVAEQLLAFVTVTLYKVVLAGETVIDCVVSPEDHK